MIKTKTKAPPPRTATVQEDKEFAHRLQEALDRVQKRLALLHSPGYELRVMTVRTHSVRAHTRSQFQKTYLAKIKPTEKKTSRKRVTV
jgi:hypothetical protein